MCALKNKKQFEIPYKSCQFFGGKSCIISEVSLAVIGIADQSGRFFQHTNHFRKKN